MQRSYGKSMFSFTESGWDCNSRMGISAYKYNWVDLNALLYGIEQNMAYFSNILQNGQTDYWQEKANSRVARMCELMWNENLGTFCDYNFETGKKNRSHLSRYVLSIIYWTLHDAASR